MSKREKIIVVAMLLSILYGTYIFYIEPSKHTQSLSGSRLNTYNKFISNVADLTKDELSDIDAYVIERVPKKWTWNPMLKKAKKLEIEPKQVYKAKSSIKLDISYTGYINMNGNALAIINGLEYEKGDVLAENGLTVEQIYTDRVVVTTKNGKRKITVRLKED